MFNKKMKHVLSNIKLKGYMHPMFTAALFTIGKTWKKPRSSSLNERIKKMWCVCTCGSVRADTDAHAHTLEYYSAIKRRKSCTVKA